MKIKFIAVVLCGLKRAASIECRGISLEFCYTFIDFGNFEDQGLYVYM